MSTKGWNLAIPAEVREAIEAVCGKDGPARWLTIAACEKLGIAPPPKAARLFETRPDLAVEFATRKKSPDASK